MSDEEPKRKLKRPPMPGAGRPFRGQKSVHQRFKAGDVGRHYFSDYAKDPDNEDPDASGSLTQYMKTVANRHPELFFPGALQVTAPRNQHTLATRHDHRRNSLSICGRSEKRHAGCWHVVEYHHRHPSNAAGADH